MAWGRTLASYDSYSGAITSWSLPAYSGLWPADSGGLYGNIVALTIDASGEIWAVADEVSGIFGFNPISDSWDRTVNLPFLPTSDTVLAAPGPGLLTISGSALDGKFTPVFAAVTPSSRSVTMLPAKPSNYVVTGIDEIVYVDGAGTVARFSLSAGVSTVLLTGALVDWGRPAGIVVDPTGDVWFAMSAYRSVGVAMLDPSTGAITRFPFPYIEAPGRLASPDPTCVGAPSCIPSSAVFDGGVQALAVDSHGDLWVITEVADHVDPSDLKVPSPIYELTNKA
jgi:hypothetical protein